MVGWLLWPGTQMSVKFILLDIFWIDSRQLPPVTSPCTILELLWRPGCRLQRQPKAFFIDNIFNSVFNLNFYSFHRTLRSLYLKTLPYEHTSWWFCNSIFISDRLFFVRPPWVVAVAQNAIFAKYSINFRGVK